jgi:lysyl-tRNA synthetase class 2
MDKKNTVVEHRKQKIEELKSKGVALFPNDFIVTHEIDKILKKVQDEPESCIEQGEIFIVAGRIMAINKFGKSSFIRFKDRTGQMQAYISKDHVGNEAYDLFKLMDIGDFTGLKGKIFKTKTGEWTLLVDELRLISKAIRPLPEKFHGLKDPEQRYRKRYVDLIMNSHTRDIFIKRSKIIQSIRNFLLERDFLEVETPMMQPIPGGAEAKPFVTRHNALGVDLFLRIAPELYLKRLVVGGFERVFEINRNFRNEGVSARHNPEFTMLEFYQAFSTYSDLMNLTEEMFAMISKETTGSTFIEYQGHNISFESPWRKMTLLSALEEIGGIDASILKDKDKLCELALSKGIAIAETKRYGKIITKLFDVLVEPQLIQPTFITGYPVEVSPLSRKSENNAEITDRFELFIAGFEIANGFSEINDPVDQKERFQQQVEDRNAGDDEAHYMDMDYIEALEYGMPPTAGEGIGIDRLAMIFSDVASIREVILFPHMKPVGSNA